MPDFVMEISKVTWRDENAEILHDASLGLAAGECVGVRVAGEPAERALFRIFSTLEAPDAGVVRFEGKDLDPDDEEALLPLRRQLAYLPRTGALISNLTLIENITLFQRYHFNWGWDRAREYAAPMIELFDIGAFIEMRPSDVDDGSRRLAVFVRELLKDCRVILVEDLQAHLSVQDVRTVVDHLCLRKTRDHAAILVFDNGSDDALDPLMDHRVEIRGGRVVPVDGPTFPKPLR